MATEAEDRARLEELNGRARLAELNAKAGSPRPAVEEPPELATSDQIHDVGTALGRVATDTADFDNTLSGLASKGIDKVMTKFPQFFSDRPMAAAGGAIAQDYLRRGSERTAPSELLPAGVKEKITERNIPLGQNPSWDRKMLATELGAGVLVNPTRAASHLLSAGGGVAGSEVGKWVDEKFDTSYGRDIGLLTGALFGGSVGSPIDRKFSARGGVTTQQRYRAGTQIEAATEQPLSATQDALRAVLRDPDRADEIGTVGDLLQDRGIMSVENLAARPPRGADRFAEVQAARDAQIAEQAGGMMSGARPANRAATVDAAGDVVQEQAGLIRAAQTGKQLAAEQVKTAGLSKARAAAADKEALVDVTGSRLSEAIFKTARTEKEYQDAMEGLLKEIGPPGRHSKQVFDATEEGFKDAGEEASKLWKKFDAGPDVSTGGLKDAMNEYMADVFPPGSIAGQEFQEKFSKYLRQVSSLKPSARPDDLSYIISRTKSVIENAHKTGNADILHKRLSEVNKVMDEFLESPYGSPKYEAARKATRDMYKEYDIYDAKAAPETFLRGSSIAGQEGLKTARTIKATNDAEVVRGAEDYVLSLAKKHVEDGGDINKFIAKNSEFIDEFQRLKTFSAGAQKAQSKVNAQRTGVENLKTLKKRQVTDQTTAQKIEKREGKGLTQAVKEKRAFAAQKRVTRETALEKSIAARYKKDPDKAISSIVSSATEKGNFKKIYQQMKDGGVGEEFKSSVKDYVMNTIGRVKEGVKEMPGSSIDDFAKVRPQLEDAGIISKAEGDKVAKLLERTKSKGLRQRATPATIQDVSEEMSNLAASAIAAQTTTVLPAGHSLMMAGAVRRAVVKWMSQGRVKPDPMVMKELRRVLSDPSTFDEFVKDVANPKMFEKQIYAKILAIEQVTGEEEEQ